MAGITLLLRVFMLLLIGGTVLLSGTPAQRIRVRRQNMKVRINATGDTIVMKFVRPSQDVKLEGYILGYGRSVFSKQFIQLPENGQMYETELDAEPKYLVAVQPIPVKDGKKHCTGKVNLEKPLHLVIGSISPTAVLLSWGNHLKTPYEKNIMNECLEDGFYTIRYRERNRKWIYQTCPTSDTVIDHLKPDTQYEFGVRSNKDDRSGLWSKPVIHNTNMGNKKIQKPYKPRKTVANSKFHSAFPPPPALQNRTRTRVQPGYSKQVNPGAARTSSESPESQQETLPLPGSSEPKSSAESPEKGNSLRINRTRPADRLTPALPKLLPSTTPRTNITASPVTNLPSNGDSLHGQTTKAPSRAPEKHPNTAVNNSVTENRKPGIPSVFGRSRASMEEQHHGSSVRTALNSRPNDVRKPGETDKVNRPEKSGNPETLKVKVQAGTTKPTKQERRQTISTAAPTAVTRQESWEDSDLFKSQPTSDVDALGKKRYVAPHVVYKTGKKPDEPCSITSSLNYFPEDEPGEVNVTSPPRNPPSNLTVVTVEGCPSFIILDWEKPDNHTTEYEVISTAKGPDGERVSILTTNQTHTAVENLNPESSYEFKVKPKNELGEGPLSEPVSFNTESADPRVSENVSGKDAIWTQFPFKTDSYSDCHGKQYVKRTWYRKFVGVQLCNSLRYKIYLGETLNGEFHNIGDQSGFGEDHCQFVDSFLDGRTGRQLRADQLPSRNGFFRALRQEPVNFGLIGGHSHINYVSWYECGTPIPGKW
ncbi:PREDICTED: target of Nesh-SH3-like isoform X7 [Cyprinodon variegatus]|uniref:ABI family, member 3 (NESH) binding protein b n=1 Tax=Cyprinodon variegatus TaxID=28743 RepID=A0A3Q2C6X8_CYPVA|nr:PREDICTED: target of Nesh-SH3-like isoform X7 [Cyprinodon variegatus]